MLRKISLRRIHNIIASLHFDDPLVLKEINKDNIHAKNDFGSMPLHYACISQRKTVIEKIVNLRANINAQDRSGMTPLMIACRNCDKSVIDFLLDNGANVNLEDRLGNTAVLIACHRQLENKDQLKDNEKIVERLLDAGATLEIDFEDNVN